MAHSIHHAGTRPAEAAPGAVPHRRYSYVRALCLSWESSPTDSEKGAQELKAMREQSLRLMKVLKRLYNIEIEEFEIPRSRSYTALSRKLTDVCDDLDKPEYFLLIYYGGHGSVSDGRHAIWQCFNTEQSPRVDWTNLQGVFLDSSSSLDVLIIIDCCRAASCLVRQTISSNTGNIVHVLAACDWNDDTLLSGEETYTALLIAELKEEKTIQQAPKASQLASQIAWRLYSLNVPPAVRRGSSTHFKLVDCAEDRELRLMQQPSLVLWPAPKATGCSDQLSTRAKLDETAQSRDHDQIVPRNTRSGNQEHSSTATLTQLPESCSTLFLPPYNLGSFQGNRTWTETHGKEDMLRALTFQNMNQRSLMVSDPAPGTGQWIYHHEAFREWLTSQTDGSLWIRGHGGSGKSTLMKAISSPSAIRQFVSPCAPSAQVLVLSYMFWGAGTPLQRSMSGMFRALLSQALQTMHDSSFERLMSLYKGFENSAAAVPFNLKALSRMWEALLADISPQKRQLTIYIFIDALDECKTNDATYAQFKDWLSMPGVRLCVASRPWLSIAASFDHVPQIRPEDFTALDIGQLIATHLERRRLQLPPKLLAGLMQKSEGNILWVVLVIAELEALSEPPSAVFLQGNALSQIPASTEALYSRILQLTVVSEGEGQSITACLYRILAASRADVIGITGIEMEPALTTRSNVRDINEQISSMLHSRTNGMLVLGANASELTHDTGHPALISYVHQTARQFFEDYIEDRIAPYLPPTFDANLVLLGSSVMQLKRLPQDQWRADDVRNLPWWGILEQGMTYARGVPRTHEDVLVNYMDALDQTMTEQLYEWDASTKDYHWSSLLPLSGQEHKEWQDNFLSIAIQHSVFNYVRAKVMVDRSIVSGKAGRPLLDYAISSALSGSELERLTDDGNSLAIVLFLLDHGAQIDDVFQGQTILQRLMVIKEQAQACDRYSDYDRVDKKRHEMVKRILDIISARTAS